MKTKLLLIILIACCLSQTNYGQDPVNNQSTNLLDVIPTNSRIGLAWPKITELGPKVHKLAQEVYPGSGQMIVSTARSFFTEAGIDFEDPDFKQIIDRKRPGAMFGVKVETNYYQVNVLPVGDLQKLAAMLKVDLDRFQSGEILQQSNRRNYVKYFGGFIYTARHRESLESIEFDSPIRKQLTAQQQQPFLSSDAVLFLDKELAVDVLDGVFGWFGDLSWLTVSGEDQQSNELMKLVSDSGEEFEFGLMGFEFDGGLGLNYTNFFTEVQGSQVQKLIETIRGGDGASNLDHLPNDNFVAAFAARGNGTKNVMAARALLKAIVNRASPGEEVLSAPDKPVFYDAFANIWQQLNGSRLAVYRIKSQTRTDGNLAAVAIFDVAEPNRLLAQLPELVKFANESAERNTAKEDLLPIRFNYLPAAMKISGYPVDILEVDTGRLDDETKKRFQVLFGEQAKQFKLIPVKNHLLMLVGTNTELLTQTIENLAKGQAGLSSHPTIVSANKRIDSRRKIEAHFSFPNLLDLYTFKASPQPYQQADEVSSLAFTIEPNRVGIDSWFPAREIDAAIDWSILW